MIFRVADAIFWIAVVCCSLAQLAILRSVLVVPAGRAGVRSRWPRAAEIAWAVLPGIALAVVLVFTWHAMHPVLAVSGGWASDPLASSRP